MKSLKKLIAPVAVLAVVIAGLFVARGIAKRENPEDSGTADVGNDIELLTGFTSDMVTRVSFVSETGEISVDRDGDIYYLTSDRTFPLDQTVGAMLVSDALGLTASGSVPPTGADDEYGLENPGRSVVITLKNGGKTTVSIGDYNPYSGTWYARIDGGGAVYLLMTDISDDFELSLGDMIKHDVLVPPAGGLSSVKNITLDFSERDDVVYTFVPGTDEVTDEDGRVVTEAVPDGFSRKTGDAEEETTESASADGLAVYDEITNIPLETWYEYGATDDAVLSEYGLGSGNTFCRATITYTESVTAATGDSSSSTVTVDVEKSVTLLIGSTVTGADSDDGGEEGDDTENYEEMRYVKTENGGIIYVVPAEAVGTVLK